MFGCYFLFLNDFIGFVKSWLKLNKMYEQPYEIYQPLIINLLTLPCVVTSQVGESILACDWGEIHLPDGTGHCTGSRGEI